MVERAIVNASPVILLSRVGRLELLRSVARNVCIPVPVVDEVEAKGSDDMAAQALSHASWATRVDPGSMPAAIAAWNLGAGESAVLAVARAMPGAHAIVDHREARRCAAAPGVPAFGTVGVVLRAKRLGAVPVARPVLERLATVWNVCDARTVVRRRGPPAVEAARGVTDSHLHEFEGRAGETGSREEEAIMCVICRQSEIQPGKASVTLERGGSHRCRPGGARARLRQLRREYLDETTTAEPLNTADAAAQAGVQVSSNSRRRAAIRWGL